MPRIFFRYILLIFVCAIGISSMSAEACTKRQLNKIWQQMRATNDPNAAFPSHQDWVLMDMFTKCYAQLDRSVQRDAGACSQAQLASGCYTYEPAMLADSCICP
ncbi:MAG: hypothetical protein ACXVA9_04940 [Bdellovibrionales bacterium]